MRVNRIGIPLPSLNALRAFEAAARHLSFKMAAEELHVSPTAVSHQVKALEEYLQVRLFRRLHRALELTEEAQAALPKLREGFECLAEAVEALRRKERTRILSISAPPAFVTKWLVPRLRRFVVLHPDIEVRIAATMHSVDGRHAAAEAIADPADILDETPDLEIRFGAGHYPGFRVDKLLSVRITPVCSPGLSQGEHALRSPEDLRHHTLLHDDALRLADVQADWAVWLNRRSEERGPDPRSASQSRCPRPGRGGRRVGSRAHHGDPRRRRSRHRTADCSVRAHDPIVIRLLRGVPRGAREPASHPGVSPMAAGGSRGDGAKRDSEAATEDPRVDGLVSTAMSI
jgi:DNA-binding transcriptional LysR family regulator